MSGIRQKKKEETRRAILQAAIRLFSEKGYERTSVEDLARAAGIGKGTIYGYFRDKSEVFLAFCEEEIDAVFAALAKRSDPGAPLLEKLMTLFMTQFRFVTENREFGRHFVREMAFPHLAGSEKSRDLDARYLSAVGKLLEEGRQRGELRDGIDPFLATVHFYALYLVALSGWYTGYVATEEEVAASLRSLFDQTLLGLGRNPARAEFLSP
ncbi:MAG: TetR/AcrR family transcriptional regulator [Desulfuromonadales bacterium]